MILNRNLMLALTVTASAAFVAVLAVQRRARLLEAEQNRNDLQRWENETGSFAPAAMIKPPV
jgi:hypothetical protein